MITFRRLGRLGRFGNQLFQYAGARLYAESHGFSWAFPPWIGDTLFQAPTPPLPWATRLLPTIQLADMRTIDWSERLLAPLGLWRRASIESLYQKPRNNINLLSYLQDPFSLRQLALHANQVRSWFRFAPDIDAAFRTTTDAHRPWTALHVRRGDLQKRNLTVPVDAYLQVLSRAHKLQTVFVASDSPTIGEQFAAYSPFKAQNPRPDLPDFVFDFWMLKEASTLLAGGSTFAWWAAYLSDQKNYWSTPLTHLWHGNEQPRLEHRSL